MNPDHRQLFVRFSGGGYVVLYGLDEQDVIVISIRQQREAGH